MPLFFHLYQFFLLFLFFFLPWCMLLSIIWHVDECCWKLCFLPMFFAIVAVQQSLEDTNFIGISLHLWIKCVIYLFVLLIFSQINNEYKNHKLLYTTTDQRNTKHPNKFNISLIRLLSLLRMSSYMYFASGNVLSIAHLFFFFVL